MTRDLWAALCSLALAISSSVLWPRASAALQSPVQASVVSGVGRIYRKAPINGTHAMRNDTSVSAAVISSAEPVVDITAIGEVPNDRALRVLFLSADTGGGHRASAEALARQFQRHFPGSTYDLLDVWTLDGVYPYKTLVKSYKHLSAHPSQWKLFYHLSNTIPNGFIAKVHSGIMCEKKIRKRIAAYDPDVVVSVHPAMNNAPRVATKKLSKQYGKHIPFFTVVTDLGSGHSMWFDRHVEKVYVASERIKKLARRRGGTPEKKIVMTGLPIRHDFAVQADNLGDRSSESGKAYQREVREGLDIDTEKKVVLVMGGGEGVGSLSDIVDELYTKLTLQGVDASIYVVCGRNEQLKKDLEERDWGAVIERSTSAETDKSARRKVPRKHSQASLTSGGCQTDSSTKGEVNVIGLGYVNKMAEYMVATDVLVTKAGPGTIAEAAAVGLPVMLTSFLPGQEAGNVEVVLEAGFGAYCDDPDEIAREVACWLNDDELLKEMSKQTVHVGHPSAAADIVQDIGNITHAWLDINMAAHNGERRSVLSSSF